MLVLQAHIPTREVMKTRKRSQLCIACVLIFSGLFCNPGRSVWDAQRKWLEYFYVDDFLSSAPLV